MLYVIDNIAKTIKEPYISAFRPHIVAAVTGAFDTLSAPQQESVRRMLNTWRDAGLYSDLLASMEDHMRAAAPVAGAVAKRFRPEDFHSAVASHATHLLTGAADAYGVISAPASLPTGLAALRGLMASRTGQPTAAVPAMPLVAAAYPSAAPAAKRSLLGRAGDAVSARGSSLLGRPAPTGVTRASAASLAELTAQQVPAVVGPLYSDIVARVQQAVAEGREFEAGEATRAVAKLNPPLATLLSSALAALPPTAALATASLPQLAEDPFVAAVQALLLAHRAAVAEAGCNTQGAADPALAASSLDASVAAAAAGVVSDGSGMGALIAALAAMGLPPPEFPAGVGKTFDASAAAILYQAVPVQSPHTGRMFPDTKLATEYDSLAAAITADVAERQLVARAWWREEGAWAEWRRTAPFSPAKGGPAGHYDTLAPSFFELQRLQREEAAAAEAAQGGMHMGGDAAGAGPGDSSPASMAGAGVPVDGRPNACALCGEPFGSRFHEKTGAMWFTDAVEAVDGRLMHPGCYALSRRSGATEAEAVSATAHSAEAGSVTGSLQDTREGGAEREEAMSPRGASPTALGAAGL